MKTIEEQASYELLTARRNMAVAIANKLLAPYRQMREDGEKLSKSDWNRFDEITHEMNKATSAIDEVIFRNGWMR